MEHKWPEHLSIFYMEIAGDAKCENELSRFVVTDPKGFEPLWSYEHIMMKKLLYLMLGFSGMAKNTFRLVANYHRSTIIWNT